MPSSAASSSSEGHAQGKNDTARSEPGFRELADWVAAAGETVIPQRFLRAAGLRGDAEVLVSGKAYQCADDPSRHYAFRVGNVKGQTELLMHYQFAGEAWIWRIANGPRHGQARSGTARLHRSERPVPSQVPAERRLREHQELEAKSQLPVDPWPGRNAVRRVPDSTGTIQPRRQ
jgi:hypothetical protein